MQPLAQEAVEKELERLPEWSGVNDAIQRTYQFKDFVAAMAFVNRIADAAEKAQHHPDILIRWNKVTLTLSTHDAGGITGKDFALATEADKLAKG